MTVGEVRAPPRRRITPEHDAPSVSDIKTAFAMRLWPFFGFCTVLVGLIWAYGIKKYAAAAPSDPWPGLTILFKHEGWIAATVTLIAWGLMIALWYSLRDYLCRMWDHDTSRPDNAGRDPGKLDADSLRSLAVNRRAEAIHDPPGDIFTLVGIACTFAGLVAALLAAPLDELLRALDPTQAPAAQALSRASVAAAAVVFGSSLAVGLVGSLFGIGMAVMARRLSATYSTIAKSPSELSDDFHKIAGELASIRDVLGRVLDGETAAPALRVVRPRRPPPAPPPKSPGRKK